jgi:acetyltransferase-like isoleucine patch superfamily enzyme
MFYPLLKFFYDKKPIILGRLYKVLFSNKNLIIGKNFKCDTFPKITLDKDAKIYLGDNLIFRRNVEIRTHQNSKLTIADNCRVDRGVRILSTNSSHIEISFGVRIGLYSVFNGGDSIFIGKNTLISGFVYLQTSMHNYFEQGKNIQEQGYTHKKIILGEDCWIGTHAVIFPGVNLKNKVIVGSSSVVNKSFEENSIIAGSPAKIIKKRKFNEI